MQCPHCSQPLHGVCLNCDSHFFQVGMTVRNESATAVLKERQQSFEKKKNAAELNKARSSLLKLRIVVIIAMAAGLLYLGLRNKGKSDPGSEAKKDTPVTTPIPFNFEEALEPNGHIVKEFSIEWRQSVTINIFAECQNCTDGSLFIYVLDEDNYQKFEGGELYDAIGSVLDTKAYEFSGILERGTYYAILQNTSTQGVLVKVIMASLSYKPDNQGQ